MLTEKRNTGFGAWLWSLATRIVGDSRVAKNTFLLTAGNALARGFAFVLGVLMARELGPEPFGLFFTALAWSAIVFQLTAFGLDVLLKRDLPRDLALTSKYLGNALSIRLVSAAFAVPLILLMSFGVMSSVEGTLVFVLLAMFFVVDSMTSLVMAVFEAHERMEYEALIILSRGLLILVLGAAALFSGLGVLTIAILYFAVGGVALLVSLAMVSRWIARVELHFDFQFWKSMISTSYVWAIMTLFLILNLRADSALISVLRDVEEVGLYNAAHQLTNGITFIPVAITHAFFPGLTRDFVSNSERVGGRFRRLISLNVALGLAVTLPLFFLARPLMTLLYSEAYTDAAVSLQLLTVALLLYFVSSACGVTLNAMNRERGLLIIVAMALAINIAVNLLLIPRLGYNGAGVAKLSSEATIALFGLWLVWRELRPSRLPSRLNVLS